MLCTSSLQLYKFIGESLFGFVSFLAQMHLARLGLTPQGVLGMWSMEVIRKGCQAYQLLPVFGPVPDARSGESALFLYG